MTKPKLMDYVATAKSHPHLSREELAEYNSQSVQDFHTAMADYRMEKSNVFVFWTLADRFDLIKS